MNRGYAVILTGYIGWGLFPLYWNLLIHVPAGEVLLHRMLWAVPVLVILVTLSARRRAQFSLALGSWQELRWLTLSSLVICFNWGIYIWAVANHRVIFPDTAVERACRSSRLPRAADAGEACCHPLCRGGGSAIMCSPRPLSPGWGSQLP